MRMRESAMAKPIVPAMRCAVIRCRLRKDAGARALSSVSVQRVSRMIAARTTPQVAAISIADCVAPYRGKSTRPERRYHTDPTVLNTANTAHQYAANLARNARFAAYWWAVFAVFNTVGSVWYLRSGLVDLPRYGATQSAML